MTEGVGSCVFRCVPDADDRRGRLTEGVGSCVFLQKMEKKENGTVYIDKSNEMAYYTIIS